MSDRFQALAELYRLGVIELGLEVIGTPECRLATAEEQCGATVAGLLTGMCSVLAGSMRPEGHRELLTTLIENLPTYFDTAREGLGLPPLGGVN